MFEVLMAAILSLSNHLSYSLEVIASLQENSAPFNKYLLSVKVLTNLAFFTSTLSCMSDPDGTSEDFFDKYHDLMLLVFLTVNSVVIFQNRAKLHEMVCCLIEPDPYFEPNSAGSEILNDYHIQLEFFRKVVGIFSVSVPVYVLIPTSTLFLDSTKAYDKFCVALVLGWVKTPSNFWYLIFLQVFSGSIVLAQSLDIIFMCLRLVAYILLKIKMQVRLICLELDDLNKIVEWPEESDQSSCSSSKSIYWEENAIMIRPAPAASTSVNDGSTALPETDADLIALRQFIQEQLLKKRMRSFVRGIVERHITIKRMVKLAEETFRFQLLTIFQLPILCSIVLPKLGSNLKSLVTNFLSYMPYRIFGKQNQKGHDLFAFSQISHFDEVFSFMIALGIFSYIGQTLIDMSETLRQALYNCDWIDKPRYFRQDLLIMQTVATRPLRLTVGGFYTLGMENFGNVLRATFSYISLIQSLK